LDGGAGDDTLRGKGGDVYVFGHGYGADVVSNYNETGTVRFNADVTPSQLRLGMLPVDSNNWSTLRIALNDSQDTLDIQSFGALISNSVNRFEFADGTIWNLDQINSAIIPHPTSGNDLIYGSPTGDIIAGLNGEDRIFGLAGNDILNGGMNADWIEGGEGDDILDGGADGDVSASNYGGGIGDLLVGGEGNDTYLFGLGYGTDHVRSGNGVYSASDHVSDGNDTVRMGHGVRPEDIIVTGKHWQSVSGVSDPDQNGLQLIISTTGDKLVLDQWLIPGVNQVNRVEFEDGIIWDRNELSNRYWAQTSQGGDITGATGNDTLSGSSSADYIQGLEGNDILSGGGGDDVLLGGIGNDTLNGGVGDDSLNGGLGDDTYVFGRGYGKDLLVDFDRIAGGHDRIILEPGITPNDITVSSDDAHIIININGTQDQLKIRWLPNPGYRIEELKFSNGVVWDAKAIEQKAGLDVNFAPVLSIPLADKTVSDGEAFTYTLPNTFSDPDQGDVLTYSATLADGSALPSWITFNSATKSFSGLPLGSNLGLFSIQVTATDTRGHFASDIFDLQVNPAANMVLTGTASNDVLSGKSGDDELYGLGGNDTLNGGDGNDYLDGDYDPVNDPNYAVGNDTLNGGNGDDIIFGDGGDDLLNGDAGDDELYGELGNDILNGGDGVDYLEGNDGDDRLNGGIGTDNLIGGMGNDTYVVNGFADIITELLNEGTDTVETDITLDLNNFANVENLTLTGTGIINATGNTLNNVLTGNSEANILAGGAGNDRLIGGVGNDTMKGGAGNDTYVIDVTTDIITENLNEGTDTVEAAISFDLTNIANVEKLVLTGTAATGIGNGLGNTITGNVAANTLNGGTGVDTLIGGAGNDTYVVDNTLDVVTELAGEGTDLVQSSVTTYTLSANVENLTLTGTGLINGTGNILDC
jgi:trimeric autotransporter adhesin